jgi:hypothetical protein
MNKYYQFFFIKLVKLSVPNVLRRAVLMEVFHSLLFHIWMTYGDWYNFYWQEDYKLHINSQVCYLKKCLNDGFDYSLRRITIEEGQIYTRSYIFQEAENKPKYLPYVLWEESKYADSGYDFVVKLNGLVLGVDAKNKLRSVVNEYKLAGKRYKIEN